MYKKILFVFCFALICLLSSCRVQRQEIQKATTATQVSSEKVIVYKDTTLFAPKSETSFKIPIRDLVFKPNLKGVSKPRFYKQTNGNATANIKIIHDTITVTATCDSLAIVAKIKSEFQKQISNSTANNESEINKKTGFSFFQLLLGVFLGFIIGFISCFILKTIKII